MKYLWTVWANALGVKAKDGDNVFSDDVAITRTVILLLLFLSGCATTGHIELGEIPEGEVITTTSGTAFPTTSSTNSTTSNSTTGNG